MSASLDPARSGLAECGCCEGIAAETPVEIANRPGLSAIAYRVGTHSRFKQTMLAHLFGPGHEALAGLRTRDGDDFAIALLDAWAVVADVLSFYQERIANESYLRTAAERRSLVELARLIGYEPRPGAAADAYLAFTLEEAPGAPAVTRIDAATAVQSIPGPGELPQTFETMEAIEARPAWNAMRPRLTRPQPVSPTMSEILVAGTATNLRPGDPLLIVTPHGRKLRWVREAKSETAEQRTRVTLVRDTAAAVPMDTPLESTGVFALRARASLFGHNAPDWKALSDQVRGHYIGRPYPEDWPFVEPERYVLDLDRIYGEILPRSWVAVTGGNGAVIAWVGSVAQTGLAHYAISSKVSRLSVDAEVRIADLESLRQITVYAQSEQLELAEQPITEPVGGPSGGRSIELDRILPTTPDSETAPALPPRDEGLRAGRAVAVSAERSDRPGVMASEVARLASIVHDPIQGRTTLHLTSHLAFSYARASVTINGNVAAATHGEARIEVLGSGDASQPHQRFVLREAPLTHVRAPTASGAESTLAVRVDEVTWHEAPTLYGRGATDRVFATRTHDDGRTEIAFGDGAMGARLPTGQENVQATYRKGLGLAGMVAAGQLSLPASRPLGVRSVTNPLAATGAADRETLAEARGNAPLTVRTLDRIVSLTDYEDFARAFAGIAKALATWSWTGEARSVFVTVAGPRGAAIATDSRAYRDLLAAMRRAGDPRVPLRVQSFRPALFRGAARIKVDPDHRPERVLAAVEQALRDRFSFEARAFGQPVVLSEVIAAMQAVAGVVAVDLDRLYRAGAAARLNPALAAAVPQAGADGTLMAAELLTLDPGPLDGLARMT